MRVLNIRQAAEYLRDELGMRHVTIAWVRKQAEPDAAHSRGGPPLEPIGSSRWRRPCNRMPIKIPASHYS